MRKGLIGLLILTIVGLAWFFWPKRTECAFCYTGECITSNICGPRCHCLKTGIELYGVCVSLE